MKGDATPRCHGTGVCRPDVPLQLFDELVVNDTTERISESVKCGPYRHFSLFLAIDSTSTPTTLQIKVQYLNRWTGKWHTYKQGLFSSFYYEDQDTASGIWEVFSGDCAGRDMRITLTGVGTTSSAYFTVSAGLDFWS